MISKSWAAKGKKTLHKETSTEASQNLTLHFTNGLKKDVAPIQTLTCVNWSKQEPAENDNTMFICIQAWTHTHMFILETSIAKLELWESKFITM